MRHRRDWLGLLLALAAGPRAAAQGTKPAAPNAPAAGPACSHCRARLKTVEALRAELPAAWQVALEREPVFNGDVLVVRAGPLQAQTLLLVHGLGEFGFTDWLSTMRRLADRYRVIALDLPGFGYSSSPVGKYSPTNFADVLHAVLHRHAQGPAIVAGHSMGAAVSLRLAERYPADVSKLVLVCAAGILHRTAFLKHGAALPLAVETTPDPFKAFVARLKDVGRAVVESAFELTGDPVALLRGSDERWGLVLKDRANVNAALALMDEDFSALVHTLDLPVQLIWGDDDRVAPVRTGELLASRLPRAELHLIAGADHAPMESAPQRFAGVFDRVLVEPPRSMPVEPAFEPGTQDLVCRDQVDRVHRGRWREVRIENCQALRLEDLSAERIVLRDSTVQMQHVRVRADELALDVAQSELIATACDVEGRIAIRCDASRLDLAGVAITGRDKAVEVRRSSRLIVSVSPVVDAVARRYRHESLVLENASWPIVLSSAPAEAPRN